MPACHDVGALQQPTRVGFASTAIRGETLRFWMPEVAIEQIIERAEDSSLAELRCCERCGESVFFPIVGIADIDAFQARPFPLILFEWSDKRKVLRVDACWISGIRQDWQQEKVVGSKPFPPPQALQNILRGDCHTHHLRSLQPERVVSYEPQRTS